MTVPVTGGGRGACHMARDLLLDSAGYMPPSIGDNLIMHPTRLMALQLMCQPGRLACQPSHNLILNPLIASCGTFLSHTYRVSKPTCIANGLWLSLLI